MSGIPQQRGALQVAPNGEGSWQGNLGAEKWSESLRILHLPMIPIQRGLPTSTTRSRPSPSPTKLPGDKSLGGRIEWLPQDFRPILSDARQLREYDMGLPCPQPPQDLWGHQIRACRFQGREDSVGVG